MGRHLSMYVQLSQSQWVFTPHRDLPVFKSTHISVVFHEGLQPPSFCDTTVILVASIYGYYYCGMTNMINEIQYKYFLITALYAFQFIQAIIDFLLTQFMLCFQLTFQPVG